MRSASSKIFSQIEVINKIKKLRRTGRRIVFTNGCFDLLHEGHVTYLEKARSKGDILLVALDTDAAVRKLKGPTRPINKLKQRQLVVAALECVDFVTNFGGGNPLPLIEKISPDILVKGGDWVIEKIVGSQFVLSKGGKVFSLPYIKGRSTTSMVEKIRSN